MAAAEAQEKGIFQAERQHAQAVSVEDRNATSTAAHARNKHDADAFFTIILFRRAFLKC